MGACMGRRRTSEVMFDLGGDSWSLIRVLFQDFFFVHIYVYIYFLWIVCLDTKTSEGKIVLVHYPPAQGYQSSEMLVCFRGELRELPG